MTYSKYFKINESFKNSINIEYDLNDYRKLANYIPTEDFCEIFKYYLDSIENDKIVRSTMLEGPYGKGKSYLVLVLMQSLFLDIDNEEYKFFLLNLKSTSEELYEQLLRIKKKYNKFLPVVINSNYHRFSQALNMALKSSLESVGLENLFPKTAYEIAYHVVEQWEKDNDIDIAMKKKCLNKSSMSLKKIKLGLKEYDEESYNDFVKLYNCIVNGLSFNPFASDDVVKNYKDIAYKISDYGYSGLFIVFDEFSKFIEMDCEKLISDLKILQDLAEIANRSAKQRGQMHLCCISHMGLSNYYNNKKKETVNAFRTVEGRFKEIRFNRSMNQNYHLISLSLNKQLGFDEMFNDFVELNRDFYNAFGEQSMFDFDKKELIFKQCFPLNPFSAYAAVQVSELVAQNERTLFTFISDNDSSSLAAFIANSETGLCNVDVVYDYFQNLFEKTDDEDIKKINYKVQLALSKVSDNLSKRIIKVIAIIKIIGNEDFNSSLLNLSLSLFVNEDKVQIALNELIDKRILKKSFLTGDFDFAFSNSKIIDEKVDAYLATKSKKSNITEVLNSIFENRFLLPRKYNTEHEMTRFYRRKYITDVDLMGMNSFEPLYDEEFADGFVLDVINTCEITDLVLEHFNEMKNNERIILNIGKEMINEITISEIMRLGALQSLCKNKSLDEEIRSEASLIFEDECNDFEWVICDWFVDSMVESIYPSKNKDDLPSYIFERNFAYSPKINLEMMNKEFNVTSQYIKPRNVVVNLYLNGNLSELSKYTETSPEMTVYNAVKETDSKEKRTILNYIKSKLIDSENDKVSAKEIIETLRKPPYGIRKGVLPVLIAMAMYEIGNSSIFYYENKEISLEADSINKMVDSPDKYYFSLVNGSKDKMDYISDIMTVFNLNSSNNYVLDIKNVSNALQRWCRSMPKIIQSSTRRKNWANLDSSFIELMELFTPFNINSYETVMIQLPKIFDNNLKATAKYLKEYKNNDQVKIVQQEKELCDKIKAELDGDKESSLYNVFQNWINLNKISEKLLSNDEKKFIQIFEKTNYNDLSLVEEISKTLVGVNISDWSESKTEIIINFIRKIKENSSKKKNTSDAVDPDIAKMITNVKEKKISAMGKLLKNNIDEVFSEFGDSVSPEEKIQILMGYLKELM